MVQMKAALTDLQEELDEKTNLYLDAIKVRLFSNQLGLFGFWAHTVLRQI